MLTDGSGEGEGTSKWHGIRHQSHTRGRLMTTARVHLLTAAVIAAITYIYILHTHLVKTTHINYIRMTTSHHSPPLPPPPPPPSLLLIDLLHLELLLVVLLLVLGKVCHEQLILHRNIFLSVCVLKVLLKISYAKITLEGGELWEG